MPFFVSRKKFESEISKRAAEACDEIMTQMGAELHDDLAQKLAFVRQGINLVERASRYPPEVEVLFIKIKSDFDMASVTLRKILHRLSPDRSEENTFVDTLTNVCAKMEKLGLTHIYLSSEGELVPMGEQVEMHIIRIVQELIQNAFKHSAAWHVWVRLQWHTRKLTLEVEDDGRGFNRPSEFIDRLKKKNNTLKMRSQVIGASIEYRRGQKGLLARIEINLK